MISPRMAVGVAALLVSHAVEGQFSQQGPKLVGSGSTGAGYQGYAVAVSADGSTAIVGAPENDGGRGAVWVFTRSGDVWTQQGPKLVGTGAVENYFNANQGYSVALSSDGNTAIVGGPGDNYYLEASTGAAWIFVRNGGVFTQQGPKLVGIGGTETAQGTSVALSGDGNTALVGAPLDNGMDSTNGAAWVFTRSGDVWTQQGPELVGTGAVNSYQGSSVALSYDGNTALVGGYYDNAGVGAVWVFTRSGGVWTQQGSKLVGADAVGAAYQGVSVALSGDGNTAISGGPLDKGDVGAAWVFTRSGGVFTQQGGKLVGTGAIGTARQAFSVALSADGNTAVLGGYRDDGYAGAAWVFARSGGVWTQRGSKLVGSGAVGAARQGHSVALSGDAKTAIVGGHADDSHVGATWVFARQIVPVTLTRFAAE